MAVILLPLPFPDFHVLHLAVLDAEAEGGADEVEALDAGGAGVEDHHVVVRVADNLQDVGVAADEDLRAVRLDEAQRSTEETLAAAWAWEKRLAQ